MNELTEAIREWLPAIQVASAGYSQQWVKHNGFPKGEWEKTCIRWNGERERERWVGGLEEEGGDISVISHFSFEREEIGRGKEWRFAAGMKAMPITKNKICVMEVYNSAGNRRGSQRMRGV